MQSMQHAPRLLGQLVKGIVEVEPQQESLPISELTLDSREVRPGSLFFAVPGQAIDGRMFIDQALESGAAVALYERQDSVPIDSARCYPVDDLRKWVGRIASRFFGLPSSALCVIGVTGTNGKTTCASLLTQALSALGRRSGFIGTPGWGFSGALQSTDLTTPDAITLQAQLAELAVQGADSVCLEVSSHALEQGRVEGVEFNAALFTNLSRDHLDYHASMDRYAETKLLLFQRSELESVIINVADPFGERFAASGLSAQLWTFGEDAKADVYPRAIDVHRSGITLHLASPSGEIAFESILRGRFNAANLMAVATTLLALGYSPQDISQVMTDLVPVPGRLEFCPGSGGSRPTVVVDYAHSPEALSQALTALRPYTDGQLWCVFGCGGERDRGKRALMGERASCLADRVVLTNDNPRNEDPMQILSDIGQGMSMPAQATIPERHLAIAYAIGHATPGDLILIAGKGHETSQIAAGKTIPFNDQSVAEHILGDMPC